MPTQFIDLAAAHEELGRELEGAIARVMRSSRFLDGAELDGFEREYAAYCETRHCVGVGNGLSALELTLRAAGIGEGDEVIVPAYTWFATWLAVTRAGARPVGAEVDERTYNLDPAAAAAAIGPRTAAILPVHIFGQPADMAALGELARRHDLFLLEDAAQAHGARHRGERVGCLGDAAAFSFYPTKNLGALGDGGAVTTDDDALAERLRLLRHYGLRNREEIELVGSNSRLAEIQAAALRAKLPRLDAWNGARSALASAYLARFAGSDAIRAPAVPRWTEPAWHLFVIGHPDREACAAALAERRIQTLVHYPVLPHLAGPYREEWRRGSFPIAERLADAALSLPIYPQLGRDACERVATAVLDTVAEAARSA